MDNQNLEFFSLRKKIEEVLNSSSLPLFAKSIALKTIQEETEKQYLESVRREFENFQKEQSEKE